MHAPVDLLLRQPAQLQREGHVPVHVHVRVQGIALEHHGDVAVARRQVDDGLAADADVAGRDLLQAGDHPQRRRLPAPAGPDQDDELLVAHRQVDTRHGPGLPEPLLHSFEEDLCHQPPPYPAALRFSQRGWRGRWKGMWLTLP